MLAGSHADVITFGDDVGQAVIDDDLDFDVRILRQEFRQLRPQNRVDRMLVSRDANGASGFFPKLSFTFMAGYFGLLFVMSYT